MTHLRVDLNQSLSCAKCPRRKRLYNLLCRFAYVLPVVFVCSVDTECASAQHVYWTDATTDQILQGAKDGTGSAIELFGITDYPGSPLSVAPNGLAVHGDFVYWADATTDQILQGAKDGTGSAIELFGINDYPGSLVLSASPGFIAVPIPEPSALIVAGLGAIGALAYSWRWRNHEFLSVDSRPRI